MPKLTDEQLEALRPVAEYMRWTDFLDTIDAIRAESDARVAAALREAVATFQDEYSKYSESPLIGVLRGVEVMQALIPQPSALDRMLLAERIEEAKRFYNVLEDSESFGSTELKLDKRIADLKRRLKELAGQAGISGEDKREMSTKIFCDNCGLEITGLKGTDYGASRKIVDGFDVQAQIRKQNWETSADICGKCTEIILTRAFEFKPAAIKRSQERK